MNTLPSPDFTSPAEPFVSADESVCEPRKRAGVEAFAAFVVSHLGGRSGRMLSGTCTGVSGHNSGRAWDWSIRADIPADAARVQALLSWLLADGAEMFRRAGLSYVIWDKKIFSAKHPEWRPYDGYDEDGSCARASCRDPHTSHVHFSFNEAGADGLTSFYDWLGSTTGTPAPLPLPSAPEPSFVPALAAFAVGMSGVLLVRRSRWWRKLAS